MLTIAEKIVLDASEKDDFDAIRDYSYAIRIDKKLPQAFMERGIRYRKTGRYRLAIIDPEWGRSNRQDYLIKVINLMKPRSNSLTDLIDQSQYFFSSPKEFDSNQLQNIWKQDTAEKIIELKNVLDSMNNWAANGLESNFKSFTDQRGIGIGKVMQAMRVLTCGSVRGPSLFDLMELIGKEESLKRINYAINEF